MKINIGYDHLTPTGDILNSTPSFYFTNPEKFRDNVAPHAWCNLLTHFRDYCNLNNHILNLQTCNKFIEDDEYFIYPMGTSYGPEYWLGKDLYNKDPLFTHIPERVKEYIRKGKVIVVLDLSFEGFPLDYSHHEAGFFNILDLIHKRLEAENFPETNFAFYNANMLAEEQYKEYWDIENKCNIITVLHNERMVKDQINMQLPITFQEIFDYKKQNLENMNYYLWLSRRKRSYRIALTAAMNQRNIIDKGLISFSLLDVELGKLSPQKWLMDNAYPYSQDPHISKFFRYENIDNLVTKTPMIADTKDFFQNLSMVFNRNLYEKTFFNLLSETHYDVKTIFLSEKVFKCIAWYSPILFVTTPHSVEWFKKLGYKSFEPYFNEEYDKEENHGKRMLMILDEVERICKMSKNEILDWYGNQQDILEYNYNAWIEKNSYFEPADKVYHLLLNLKGGN